MITKFESPVDLKELNAMKDMYASIFEGMGAKDWHYGILPFISDKNKLTLIFLISNEKEGNFYFYQKDSHFIEGQILDIKDILRFSKSNITSKLPRFLGEAKSEERRAFNEALERKILDGWDILDGYTLSIENISRDEVKSCGVLALFQKEGIDIVKELSKERTHFKSLYASFTKKIEEKRATVEVKHMPNDVSPNRNQPASNTNVTVNGTIDEREYIKYIRSENMRINRHIKKERKKLIYNSQSHAESTIATILRNAECGILKGEPGVGKTGGVKSLCSQNDITLFLTNFDDQTDGSDIVGSATLITNLITGNQEVGWNNGILIESALHARQAAREGKSTICFLDEISRGQSHGKLIGLLSKDPNNKEFAMEYDRPMLLMKMHTNKGEFWFEISDEIDRSREPFSLSSEDASILLDDNAGFFCYSGDAVHATQRANRGDMLMMGRSDFTRIQKENNQAIIRSHETSKCVYVPDFALTVIGATNVSKSGSDQVNDLPEALISRMPIKEIESSSIREMVRIVLEGESYLMNWTANVSSNVESVLVAFFESAKQIFDSEEKIIGETIALRLMSDTIRALNDEDPFHQEDGNIFTILKESVCLRFAKESAELPIGSQLKNENVRKAMEIVTVLEERGIEGVRAKEEAQKSVEMTEMEIEIVSTPSMRM